MPVVRAATVNAYSDPFLPPVTGSYWEVQLLAEAITGVA